MSRKQSREVAFKMLFSLAFKDCESCFEIASDEMPMGPEKKYIEDVCSAVRSNIGEIDRLIAENAKGFSFDRIFKVDLTALRLAVGEILFMEETPNVVAINEAVNIVKKYGTQKSAAYVNGILATVLSAVNGEK